MRILYDGQIFTSQSAGGVNRYFANLIGRLPATYHPYLTTTVTSDVNFPRHPNLKIYRYRRFSPAGLSFRLERYFFDLVGAGLKFDLVHPTYYTLLTRREMMSYRFPVVLTVWDMIHELFPETDPTGRHREAKRTAVAAAQAIICISENTKRDLLAQYNVDESKVSVTHLASDIDLSLLKGDERTPSRPYFLYVGARAGYKNFDGLLSAFAAATTRVPEIILCLAGPPFSRAEENRIAQLGLTGRVENYGQISDRELAALYQRSVAFVYPSLYEGFGIPPLEAMQCGTMVVAANRSSIPEVVGDAGILFDPMRPDELADILVSLARNPDLREPSIARGYERARQFSWDETSRRTLNVYRSLVTV